MPLFDCWVLIAGDEGERESLGRTGGGGAKDCVISNSDAGVAVVAAAWRTRTVCGLLGAPPDVRERSVPREASAARGGRETVPLVECVLTVANASIASEVRRLLARRVEAVDVSGGSTVRLLARLRRPIGEGGSVPVVVGLPSVVLGCCCCCCASSARSIGQRCMRRRNP